MIAYFAEDEQAHANAAQGKSLPYTFVGADPRGAYYDFRAQPELIDRVLEDLTPFGDRPAVQAFYDLLRWLNGPASPYESTDCLLRPPGPNGTPQHGQGAARQITGRLMIVLRDKVLNTDPELMGPFGQRVEIELSNVDQGWQMGAIGYAFYKCHFTELGPLSQETAGRELSLSYWAWGNTDDEVFDNLGRLVSNLQTALQATAAHSLQ